MTSVGPEEPLLDVPASGAYAVKLSIFEGPLDLLLHLIRLNEVDVADIPIAAIAEQYCETLELMHELNLDVAGEYLVMAATLAWIKSRLLLPPTEDEEAEEPDPRAELVARLLEYQRFKEAAEGLEERQREGRDVFRAEGAGLEPAPEGEREIEVSLLELVTAFRAVLRRAQTAAPGVHEVEAESVTVRERMLAVMERVAGLESLEFERVFELEGTLRPSRAVLVTTFLALLELVRLAAIRVYQGVDAEGVPSGPIRLRGLEPEAGPAWRERIAEIM
jgi:segregation and condensation protein A